MDSSLPALLPNTQYAGVCVCVCVCLHAQSCPTLCYPIEYNPPGSSVHGISQQEYWNGLQFPSLEDLPDPGIEPTSPALSGEFFTPVSSGKTSCLSCLLLLKWLPSTGQFCQLPASRTILTWAIK